MLSSEDIFSYFRALPRNITVHINGVDYKCNKFCLTSFSSVISKHFSDPDNANSNYVKLNDLPETISNSKIKTILEFLHNQESFDQTKLSSFEDIFDYYIIAASLGIIIVKNRLCSRLTTLINGDNVSMIYERLSSFPDFYEPITHYFDNNNFSVFQNFIDNNLFNNNNNFNNDAFLFLHSFICNSKNSFQSEDSKLSLVRLCYDKTGKNEALNLYDCIYPEKLSKETLSSTFLEIPLKEGKFMKCFKLISILINEKFKTIETLKREKDNLSKLNTNLKSLKNEHLLNQSIASLTSSRFSIAIRTEYEIKADTKALADRIEMLAADVALIPVQNETTIKFLQTVDKMNEISKELNKLMQYFYENFGWLLWPGSSVSTMNDAKSLDELMTELEKIVSCFKPDQESLLSLSQLYIDVCSKLRIYSP